MVLVEYSEIREKLLEDVLYLQRKKYSYQSLCDYINSKQDQFVLFKDFFSRFRTKQGYYKGKSKEAKLALIYQHLNDFRKKNQKQSGELEGELIQLIQEANQEEFKAYTQVNTNLGYSDDGLADYFGMNDPAGRVILNNLRHKKQYEWILCTKEHKSAFKILDIRLTNMFSEYATVYTNEYWKLCWRDKKTKTLQFLYDEINEQSYLVAKKKNGKWLIQDNIYGANDEKRRPKYIDQAALSEMINQGEKANFKSLKKLLDSNELGLALAFLKRLSEDRLGKRDKEKLQLLNNRYLENLRALNTNNSSIKKFISRNAELNKEIMGLWKSIFRKT